MNELTSIEWVRRTHARMPLTLQEQAVKDILIDRRVPFETHHVFELSPKARMSVDFLVFYRAGIVLECTYCGKRRGSAISEVKRRSAFINYRFGLLKYALPELVCEALIEAPNEDQCTLRESVKTILSNADSVVVCLEELGSSLVSQSREG